MAALAPLPPWVNVQPSQGVEAARAGTNAGVAIAAIRQREAEAAAEQARIDAAAAARRWEFDQSLAQKAAEQMADREQAQRVFEAGQQFNLRNLGLKEKELAAQQAHWKALEASALNKAPNPIYRTRPDGSIVQILPTGGYKEIVPAGARRNELTQAKALEIVQSPTGLAYIEGYLGPEYANWITEVAKGNVVPQPTAAPSGIPAAAATPRPTIGTPTIPTGPSFTELEMGDRGQAPGLFQVTPKLAPSVAPAPVRPVVAPTTGIPTNPVQGFRALPQEAPMSIEETAALISQRMKPPVVQPQRVTTPAPVQMFQPVTGQAPRIAPESLLRAEQFVTPSAPVELQMQVTPKQEGAPELGEIRKNQLGTFIWNGNDWSSGPANPKKGDTRIFGGQEMVFTGTKWEPYPRLQRGTAPAVGPRQFGAVDITSPLAVTKGVTEKTRFTGEYPAAPTNPKSREYNKIYLTPLGPMQWQGKGWQYPT